MCQERGDVSHMELKVNEDVSPTNLGNHEKKYEPD